MKIKSLHNDDKSNNDPWYVMDKTFSAVRNGLLSKSEGYAKETQLIKDQYYSIELSPPFGEGTIDYLDAGDEISVIIVDATFLQPQTFNLTGDGWLRFHFRVSLENSILFESSEQYDLSGQFSQMLLVPKDYRHTDSMKSNSAMKWISIYCKKSTITETLQIPAELFEDQVENCLSEDSKLYLEHRNLDKDMIPTLQNIFDCNLPAPLKKVYLKSKILNLITVYLAQCIKGNATKKSTLVLKDHDWIMIEKAKEILESSTDQDIGILQLSKIVGLNRNKLNLGFKQLYGKTVHEYHLEQRLLKAWELLQETTLSLNVISSEVGYAHHPSFTASFKKHFGINPKDVRKK